MPALVRNNAPRGVRFYIDKPEGEEVILFLQIIDACTRNGPRKATEEDAAEFPEAWAQFEAETADPTKAYLPPGARPLVQFADPPNAEIPEAAKAKGAKAPA